MADPGAEWPYATRFGSMLEVPAPGGAGETVRALDVWCSLDLYLDLEMPARVTGLAPGEPIPVACREYPDAEPSELARVTIAEWVTDADRAAALAYVRENVVGAYGEPLSEERIAFLVGRTAVRRRDFGQQHLRAQLLQIVPPEDHHTVRMMAAALDTVNGHMRREREAAGLGHPHADEETAMRLVWERVGRMLNEDRDRVIVADKYRNVWSN